MPDDLIPKNNKALRGLTDDYIPTGLSVPLNVYKRADASIKEQIRRNAVQQLALTMTPEVISSIAATVQKHPEMSPGTIETTAQAFQGLRWVKTNILSLTNDALGGDLAQNEIANADASSLAAEKTYGSTPSDPIPGTPGEQAAPQGEDPVPDPDTDQEGALGWLDQHLPHPFATAAEVLLNTAMPLVAAPVAATKLGQVVGETSSPMALAPLGIVPPPEVPGLDEDSWLANKLTDTVGSPSPDIPDPSVADYVGPAVPRMFFGTVMNAMMAPIDFENAARRQWSGEDAKARELVKRYGLTTEEQYRQAFGDKGEVLWRRLNDAQEELQSNDRSLGDMFLSGFTRSGTAVSQGDVIAPGAIDDTVPEGTLDVGRAKEEWDTYQQDVHGDGGMLWNSTDLMRNVKAGNLAQTPWFGGEANNRDGVLGKEVYAGTVYDVRTWDEKQAIAQAVATRKAAYEASGVEMSTEEYEKLTSPRPWTMGRALAGEFADPETFAYKGFSGAIDFMFSLGADPFSYVPGAAFTKTGKAATRGAAKALHLGEPFAADAFMTAAKKGHVAQVREVLDGLGVSDIPKKNLRWDKADDVVPKVVDWADDGTGTLRPTVTKPLEHPVTGGPTTEATKLKGVSISKVETRDFGGNVNMFRRGDGWAVQISDGTVRQFTSNREARAFAKANGATGRGTVGTRTGVFDDKGGVQLFDDPQQARIAAEQNPALGGFESTTLRKQHSPMHYTVSHSGKNYDVQFNRSTKQWDIIDDGAKVSSHPTLTEAESALTSTGTKRSFDLVDDETGQKVMRATMQPDGRVVARGRVFPTLDDARDAHLEPINTIRDRLHNSEVARLVQETKFGRDLVQAFIEATSPTAIFRRSNKKIDMETAGMLAQAKTFDEVARVMEARFGVSIADPAAIKNFTGMHAKAYNATLNLGRSEGLKKAIYRWGQLSHNTNIIDLDDADDVADQLWRMSIELGASPDDADRFIDEMTGMATSVERRQFFEDVMLPGLFDRRLKQLGVDKSRRAQFRSKFKFENDKSRKLLQDFDDKVTRTVGDKAVIEANASGGRAAFDNPMWAPLLDEFGDEFTAYAVLTHSQHLVLPSARNLRKETNAMARAFRKVTDKSNYFGEDAADTVINAMSTMMDHWRSVTLMNSAYILRNIAEEAIRAGFMGNASVLTHPGHYLALLSSVYSARAGAMKFNRFNRYARRMRKLSGMADTIMYDPGKYQGAMLVKPQALLDLVDVQLANSDAMLSAWGKKKRAATVGRDVGKHGVIEPIDVVYDPATGRYGIANGKKRVILAAQHDVEVPVRIRPGALPGREKVISGGKPPANAPVTTTTNGIQYSRAKDGTWVKVNGKQYGNTVFVGSDDATDIRNAMLSGRFTVGDDGKILGLKFTGSVNEKKLRELMHGEGAVSRDEAWRQAGGTVEEVWHAPRNNPSYGNVPVEWDDSGFNIGQKIKETRGRTSSIESQTYGPGGLMFHTSPKANRELIGRTGLRPGKSGVVSLSEEPYQLGKDVDVWIVDTRGFPLVPKGGDQTLAGEIPKRRIRRATDQERLQLQNASGTGRNPLQPADDAGVLDEGADLGDRIAAMAEPEPYGKAMPAGWQDSEVTHELLFGDAVTGNIHDVMNRAKQAVDDYLGWRRAIRYINPYYKHSAARIVGEGQFDDLIRHAAFSDNAGMSNIGRQSVMVHGQNIADDQPGVAWMPGQRQITFEDDPEIYVKVLAENIQDQLRLEETRDFLAGRMTVDQLVDRIMHDPDRAAKVYTMLDAAKVNAARGRKVVPKWGDEVTIKDVERFADLDESVMRERIKNLIILQNAQATDYMGKGTSRALTDAIAEAVNDGGYQGIPIGPNNRAFTKLLASELENNPSFRESLPMQLDGIGHEYRKVGLTKVANAFFEKAGNFRDLMTQHPLMREEYVNEVSRLMKWTSESDKQRIVKNLIEWNDEPLARKLEAIPSAGDEGLLSMEMVERLADKHARNQAKAKFYDAAERRNWAVALRWAGPFLQVAANSTWAWGKAMATNTPDVYRTIRSINTLKDADLDPIYRLAGLDPSTSQALGQRGVMYRDQYGEERFLLPALGVVSSILPFLPAVAATANTSSVDLFQDGLLGSAGPVLQFAASMIFPDAQARDDMVGDIARKVQKYPLPSGSPLDKAAQSFMPVKWRNLLTDGPREADVAQAVLVSRMQHGEFGDPATWSEEDFNAHMATVKRDTTWLIGLEALGKLVFPTLGSWQYEPIGYVDADTTDKALASGDVLTTMLTKEYRKVLGDSEGEDRRNRIALFRQLFGEFADLDSLGSKENRAVESVGASTEYAYQHRELYDSWNGAMSYMMPEGDYETQWNAKEQFLRRRNENIGWTERRSVQEQLDYARQYMLDAAYRAERKLAEERGADSGDLTVILDRYRKSGYDTDWTPWTAQTMADIERMMDEDGEQIVATVPSAKYVKKYFWLRNQVQQRLDDRFGSRSLATDQALEYDPGLTALFMAGEQLAARDPGFSRFWSLAQREYGDDNMDAIRNRSAD